MRYLEEKQDKKLQVAMFIMGGMMNNCGPNETVIKDRAKLAWMAAGELWKLAEEESERERPNHGEGHAHPGD